MNSSNPKSDFVDVNGIRLHYLDWGGSGPNLLFLTGMGSSAYIYNKFAPRFTDMFRVLALTRRGHGDSDYPESGYDADTLVEDIRQFMDRLHIDKAILAGHSLAGVELTGFHFGSLSALGALVYCSVHHRSDREGAAAEQERVRCGEGSGGGAVGAPQLPAVRAVVGAEEERRLLASPLGALLPTSAIYPPRNRFLVFVFDALRDRAGITSSASSAVSAIIGESVSSL